MRRDYKCNYCGKPYAMAWARDSHERSCRELYNSKRRWVNEKGKR